MLKVLIKTDDWFHEYIIQVLDLVDLNAGTQA